MKQIPEKSFQTERAGDAVFNLREFFCGELFPTRTDRSMIPEAAEEELAFGEGETHLAREANQQDTVESVRGIATLAADTVGRGEQSDTFIVADRGGLETGARGKFADFHGTSPGAATMRRRFNWRLPSKCDSSTTPAFAKQELADQGAAFLVCSG